MSPSDKAEIRQHNAQTLRDFEFIQREIARRPKPAKREPSVLEPLIPPGWNAELGVMQDDPAERELTMRGLRGWGRMK